MPSAAERLLLYDDTGSGSRPVGSRATSPIEPRTGKGPPNRAFRQASTFAESHNLPSPLGRIIASLPLTGAVAARPTRQPGRRAIRPRSAALQGHPHPYLGLPTRMQPLQTVEPQAEVGVEVPSLDVALEDPQRQLVPVPAMQTAYRVLEEFPPDAG